MISFEVARVTLSGSYHRDIPGLRAAYDELIGTGCQVVSPHRLDFDEAEFVRDAAETSFSIEEIERHHLLAIDQSDFVWLHAPDGYIGKSAAFEIGYATAHNIPVFSKDRVTESVLQLFVKSVASVYEAKCLMRS